LEGLAPVVADAYDNQDEGDGAPEQKKGYIRKYALDPVTGQYKQVGVYEAGGDPNVDVSDKAGTAGAFGGVGQSNYQKTQGMASGGTATDSQRVYDYLMGRGENPMQFTHTAAPQVNYTPYTPKPITPTTPILDQQYDEYGNPIGKNQVTPDKYGGGLTAEQRAEQAADNAKPQAMLNGLSRDQYFGGLGLTHEEQNAVRAQADKDNPKTAGAINFVKTLAAPVYTIGKAIFGEAPVPADPLYSSIVNADAEQRAFAQTGSPLYSGNPYFGDAKAAITSDGPVVNVSPPTGITAGFDYGAMDGYSSDQQAADARADAESRSQDRDTSPVGSEHEGTQDRDSGGPSDARGGYLHHGQFDQRMARGGVSGHLRPPQPFYANGKFSYKGPQVYADGGGIADLAGHYNLGGYSDGGRLLKGPGDGVSDDIPATIGHGQPARLADGEFVVPARIVSEIGNGSTDAGARELYKMMDRIQAGRRKTVGKDQVATNSKAVRHLPA
jgi:hypothetical protein